jgi:hypothetical protein
MGSAGLQFDAGDLLSSTRLNQKTNFVGTTAQVSGATRYAGMLAYDTDTDDLKVRNAANNADATLVSLTKTQTITGKTVNTTDNTVTATSQATGDILKNNGTKFVRMARGSANQVLRVNSGGTDLEFGALPGPGLQFGSAGTQVLASASSTAYSAAAGQVSRSPGAIGNKILIFAVGTLFNNTQSTTQRTLRAAIHVNGVEGKWVEWTTGTTAGNKETPFFLHDGIIAAATTSHTFDIRVRSLASAADSQAGVRANVEIELYEFGA